MSHLATIRPEFVEFIPRELAAGVLYISIPYKTAVHACACGCGSKVVTPISPVRWRLTYDGETVSLYPSVGNWSYPCESHYWVRENRVEWAPQWTKKQIEANRAADRALKENYQAERDNDAASLLAKRQLGRVQRLVGRLRARPRR